MKLLAAAALLAVPAERCHITTLAGVPLTLASERGRWVDWRGRRCLRTDIRRTTRARVRGRTIETVVGCTRIEDERLRAVWMKRVQSEGWQKRTVLVEVREKEIVFTLRATGCHQEVKVERKGGELFRLDGRVLRARGWLKDGETREMRLISPDDCSVLALKLSVRGLKDGGFEVLASDTASDAPSARLLLDAEGGLVELSEGMLVTRPAPDGSSLPRTPVSLSGKVRASPAVARVWELSRLKVLLKTADPRASVPASFYCDVSRADEGLVLTLRETRPDGSLPPSPEPDEALVLANVDIPSSLPVFKDLASEIAGGEEDGMRRVVKLVRWVRRNMRRESLSASRATALEALKRRTGDCTEHAYVYCALARALGIPTRCAIGLVLTGDSFEFHEWTESYLDDRWVPVDPIMGRVGFPACYILLGYEGEDVAASESAALSIQCYGLFEVMGARRGPRARPTGAGSAAENAAAPRTRRRR